MFVMRYRNKRRAQISVCPPQFGTNALRKKSLAPPTQAGRWAWNATTHWWRTWGGSLSGTPSRHSTRKRLIVLLRQFLLIILRAPALHSSSSSSAPILILFCLSAFELRFLGESCLLLPPLVVSRSLVLSPRGLSLSPRFLLLRSYTRSKCTKLFSKRQG